MNLTKEKRKPDWVMKPHWVWSVIIYGILGVGVIHLTWHTLMTYVFN